MGQLTPEMIDRIREEYAKTPSLTTVAKKLDLTRQTVAKYVRKTLAKTEPNRVTAAEGSEFGKKEKSNFARFIGLRMKGVSLIEATHSIDLSFEDAEKYEMHFQTLRDRTGLEKMFEQDPERMRRTRSIAERIQEEGLDEEEAINLIRQIPVLNNIRQELKQESEKLEETIRINTVEIRKNSQLQEENSDLQATNSQLGENNKLLRMKEIESVNKLKIIEAQLKNIEKECERKRQESRNLDSANKIAMSGFEDRINKLKELDDEEGPISLKIKSLIDQRISKKFNRTKFAGILTDALALALRRNPPLIDFISNLSGNIPGSPTYEFVKSSFEEARKRMFAEAGDRVFREVFGDIILDKEMVMGTWPAYMPKIESRQHTIYKSYSEGYSVSDST